MNFSATTLRTIIASLILTLTFSCNFDIGGLELQNCKHCFFSDFSYLPKNFPKSTIIEIAQKTGHDWRKSLCKCSCTPKDIDLILVDKTVKFSRRFSSEVCSIIINKIKYGDVSEIINFSSYKGHYSQVYAKVFFEPPIEEMEDCVKIKFFYYIKSHHILRFKEQKKSFFKLLYEDIIKNEPYIPKTQIILTLNEVANMIENIRANFPKANIKLIIISDMLENGDIISFYRNGHIFIPRNTSRLISKLKKEKLIPNLKGVQIYIFGLGYYRDKTIPGKQLLRLKRFWINFFKESNAEIKGIGTPLLP